jgi:hypothetical protein
LTILHIPITDDQTDSFGKVAEHLGRTKKSLQLQWITEGLKKAEAKMYKSSKIMETMKGPANE